MPSPTAGFNAAYFARCALSCNPRKTEIGASEIEYLGYRLSGDSVRMTKKRIQVINDIQAPKNFKGLQRLLGMFQYFKKLIPYFSKNTHHMRSLLKKDAAFCWTAQCQSELDYLKSCLVKDPILKSFDSNREIVIHIDGCSHGSVSYTHLTLPTKRIV